MNVQSDLTTTRPPFVVIITLALAAFALGGCGSSGAESEPAPAGTTVAVDPPAATVEPESAPAGATAADPPTMRVVTVALEAVNGSEQDGEATITAAADGVDLEVEIPGQDVPGGQFALIVAGTCAEPGAPLAGIAGTSNGFGGERSGSFAESQPIDYADATPITIERLLDSPFAILVVDATYRGGVLAVIPEGTVVYQAADREGPFGEVPFPVAACGEIPAG